MAASRIGKLYQYTGNGELTLWESTVIINDIGRVKANVPFLVIDKFEDPDRHEYWMQVLVEEKVGWLLSTCVSLSWTIKEIPAST